jgi:hypothetical protein
MVELEILVVKGIVLVVALLAVTASAAPPLTEVIPILNTLEAAATNE